MNKIKIYLDDVRTPVNVVPENPDNYDGDGTVVRDYDEFVAKVQDSMWPIIQDTSTTAATDKSINRNFNLLCSRFRRDFLQN